MIFNALALMYGIYKYSKIVNEPNNFNYYIKSIIFILILFYISVSSVNFIRANYFYVGKSVEFVKKNKIQSQSKDQKKKICNIKRN